MIITRTPFRISLGGGGTDLPSYYAKYGGYLVTSAIDRYMYILLNPRFEDSIRVSYSKTEIVDDVSQLEHPIVREALRMLGVDRGLEIVSVADLPANTGLGSSSAFAVGLLNALHTYKGENVSPKQLAEEAYTIEVERLGEPIGKQDQYISAHGGVRRLEIDPDGAVQVHSVAMHQDTIQEFENSVLLFYTGIQRRSAEVLAGQSRAIAADEESVLDAMHAIKTIGHKVEQALVSGEMERFGRLLHEHWETKKRLSAGVSSRWIDQCYDLARQHGALGGKIMGAGGGGFLMVYCDGGHKGGLRRALASAGLVEMRYSIEREGTKVILNV